MKITFYGVRGSIPAPGYDTAKYGGNTSCVYVELENGQDLILDAGTGIRLLGERLKLTDRPVNILLSHPHWDHIQGYPFFAPIYQQGRPIKVFTTLMDEQDQLFSLFDQMDGASFPVAAEDLPSNATCHFDDIKSIVPEESVRITRKELNHPGRGSAYRIEEDGASCCYVTDNELVPPNETATSYEEWVEFCRGTDVLIHDAQYQEEDMPHKHGWGHSLVSQVRQFAIDAEVRTLVMFHHDPDRTDSQIDFIQQDNEVFFQGKHAPSLSVCAAEGMQIQLTPRQLAGEAVIEVS
jgi:phosphoribosyl 1,2-cyclic phosphodiesterase